jgi:putative tricarboxylic transport membrane protein
MAKYDRMSTLFFMGLALAISVESIRIGPGSLSNPGPGLIPLGCGLLLGIIGLIVFIRTLTGASPEAGEVLWKPGTKWRNIISVFLSLICYAFLVDVVGFHTVTFLWLTFLCFWVGRMGWKKTMLTSVVTTLLSYLLFEHFLGIRFSRGIMGF